MTTTFQKCLNTLLIDKNLRTWSLIVTVFGDMARNRNEMISGPTLNSILQPIGVKPASVRVAVHRLRNEGWLDSTQKGRTSYHKLSQYGLTECEVASKVIYTPKLKFDDHWHIVISSSQQHTEFSNNEYPFAEIDHISVSPGIFIGNGKVPFNPDEYLILEGSVPLVPNWLKKKLGTVELCSSYEKMYFAAKEVEKLMSEFEQFSSLEVATLRTILVHNWRRLVLKHPPFPESFFPVDWCGQDCRTAVIKLLDSLKRPDLTELRC